MNEDQKALNEADRGVFAALILQGLMANPERYKYVVAKMTPTYDDFGRMSPSVWSQEDATRHNAEKAVHLAEALIVALEK